MTRLAPTATSVITGAETSARSAATDGTAHESPPSVAAMQEASSGGETAVVEEAPSVDDHTPAEVIATIEEPQSPAAAPMTPVDALPVVETDVQPAPAA